MNEVTDIIKGSLTEITHTSYYIQAMDYLSSPLALLCYIMVIYLFLNTLYLFGLWIDSHD